MALQPAYSMTPSKNTHVVFLRPGTPSEFVLDAFETVRCVPSSRVLAVPLPVAPSELTPRLPAWLADMPRPWLHHDPAPRHAKR